MATFTELHAAADDAGPGPSVLHIEMQSGERRALTLFAASFLEWIKDSQASSFARYVGAPGSLALDETAGDAKTATLRVTVQWPAQLPGAPAAPLVSVHRSPVGPMVQEEAGPSSLFTYDPDAPVFSPELASAGMTAMVAAVVEQSTRLGYRPEQSRHAAGPAMAALRERAVRFRRSLAGWTVEAAGVASALVVHSGSRARQAAASWRSAGRVSMSRMRSGGGWRTISPASVRPMSWATLAVVLASVIYAAWPASKTPGPPIVPQAGVANSADVRNTRGASSTASERAAASADDTRGTASVGRSPAAASDVTLEPNGRKQRPLTSGPPARGYFGSLVVTSEPRGADVSVDGVLLGRTPLAIQKLSAGSRVVRVDMPGHQRWSWAVSVAANRQTALAVKLSRAAPSH